jgi:hypothetical protein
LRKHVSGDSRNDLVVACCCAVAAAVQLPLNKSIDNQFIVVIILNNTWNKAKATIDAWFQGA